MHVAMIAYIIALDPQPLAVTWPMQGLSKELTFIARLESYYGKYLNHEPHAYGPFHTAFGSLGLKPSTAYTTYMQSPWLKKKFPDLEDKYKFLNKFWHSSELYMYTANFHWYTLRKQTPSLQHAVYSWRWGLAACKAALDDQILSDSYVTQYTEMEKERLAKSATAER